MARYSNYYMTHKPVLDLSNFFAKVKFDLEIKYMDDDYIVKAYDLGFKEIYSDRRGYYDILDLVCKLVRRNFKPNYWFSLRMSITSEFRAYNPRVDYYARFRNTREDFLLIREILNDMQFDFNSFVQDLRKKQKKEFEKQQELLTKGLKVVMVMKKDSENF